MNRVPLTGRLTRDPEPRTLSAGKTVTQFSLATNDYRAGKELSEFHSIVTWVLRPLGRTDCLCSNLTFGTRSDVITSP